MEIAEYIGVSVRQVYRWKAEHRDFRHALRIGKRFADARVKRSLYQKAVGYSHESVKIYADPKTGDVVQVPYIEHFPPDTTAGIFWLKNRKPKEWKDKLDHELTGEVAIKRVVADL